MAPVMYWTYCKDCKHEGYGRYMESKCEKCGSTNVGHIRECDEEGIY